MYTKVHGHDKGTGSPRVTLGVCVEEDNQKSHTGHLLFVIFYFFEPGGGNYEFIILIICSFSMGQKYFIRKNFDPSFSTSRFYSKEKNRQVLQYLYIMMFVSALYKKQKNRKSLHVQ